MADDAADLSNSGQRRPTEADIPAVMEFIAEGKSLRAACRELGLHTPSTHTFIHQDDGRREQYARALELRAECQQEEALDVSRAAALGTKIDGRQVDVSGARVLLDAIKWSSARMAPKTAPIQRIDVTSRTRQMTDAEIAAEIAVLEAGEAQA